MAKTKDGKRDLEAEVIARCVKAMKLEGKGDRGSWLSKLDRDASKRVLAYLSVRFGG